MTFADNLRTTRTDLERLLRDFITGYTSIQFRPARVDGNVYSLASSSWLPLKEGGKPVQTTLLAKYRQFHAILAVISAGHPAEDLRKLAQGDKALIEAIEQRTTNGHKTNEAVLCDCVKAMDQQVWLLAGFAPSPTDAAVFVPDTNALLFNPDLEEWVFDDHQSLLLVLLPAVLCELDKLKVEHRNENVRKTAEGLISRIKEYRRRGPLCDGVQLRNGVSRIMSVAKEPDFSKSLPWLDKSNADDRLLASFLEVVRSFAHSPVTLVTRDINLQNKAEFARLPFVEPPETARPNG